MNSAAHHFDDVNILHASAAYAPFVGGAETYLRTISERLVADGHTVCVATSDAGEVETFWDPRKRRVGEARSDLNGVDVRRARVAHLPLSPLTFYILRRAAVVLSGWPGAPIILNALAPFMPWIPQYERLLRNFETQFNIVHGTNVALEWPLIAAWRFARENSLPFVATPLMHVGEQHSDYVSRNYSMPHQLRPLRDADAVMVQTEIEARHLLKCGLKPERIHLLGMGVDLPSVQGGDPSRVRQTYGMAGQMVLFLGVVTKDKGIIHLIEAMRRLWSDGDEATLVIVGNPVAEFESYWKTLPLSMTHRIVRTGVVDAHTKRDLLAAATLLALPSRIDSFGIVLLEAWANGIPVIGARAGGVPAVIDGGRDGLLVDYGDVPALAAAIKRLLDDDAYSRRLGEMGRAKVVGRYTWDHIYQKLRNIYAQVLPAFAGAERRA